MKVKKVANLTPDKSNCYCYEALMDITLFGTVTDAESWLHVDPSKIPLRIRCYIYVITYYIKLNVNVIGWDYSKVKVKYV